MMETPKEWAAVYVAWMLKCFMDGQITVNHVSDAIVFAVQRLYWDETAEHVPSMVVKQMVHSLIDPENASDVGTPSDWADWIIDGCMQELNPLD